MRQEIKPELVEYGGNLVRDSESTLIRDNAGTNVVMASHQLTPAVVHDQGTSFAAPRVAHQLALLQYDLQRIGVIASAPLLKAFLVNGSQYPDRDALRSLEEAWGRSARDLQLRASGYGIPDAMRSLYCDEHTAVLYFEGQIEPDQVLFFSVPVPKDLAASDGMKRLTVTVAHYPEVQQWGLHRYLGVDVKWRMFRGDVDRDHVIDAMSRQDEDNGANIERGGEAAPPESNEAEGLPNEISFTHKLLRRSRGTVQHDYVEWKQHKEAYSDGDYTLAIAAYKRWQKRMAPAPIAVVIRIEDLGRTAKVYAHVAKALTEVQIASRAAQR
jgi:hypothetical protein